MNDTKNTTSDRALDEVKSNNGKMTKGRFFILFLVSYGVLTNYLDRAILSVAMPSISAEFDLNPAEAGIIFSAFSWTYFLSCIPAGIALDRFGTRIVYFAAQFLWSVVTLLHIFAHGVYGLFQLVAMRLLLGVVESPAFPACNKAVASWFPRKERGRAVGIYTAAEYIGLGFLSPVLFWIVAEFGWRGLFLSAGIVGIVSAIVWYVTYREPTQTNRINQMELDWIRAGGGATPPSEESVERKFEWLIVRQLFRHRKMWGLCVGQFCVNSTLVFFLTWFPTYLATERNMSWLKAGFYMSIPYIAGFCGILFAGFLSDYLLKRGMTMTFSRKFPVIAGLMGATTIILANWIDSNILVIIIMSFAFFSQSMASSSWAVIPEVSPTGRVGLVGGLFNSCSNLAGIVTPLVVGFVVSATGSFALALGFIGSLALLGAFCWIFVVDDISRMALGDEEVGA